MQEKLKICCICEYFAPLDTQNVPIACGWCNLHNKKNMRMNAVLIIRCFL